jgi:hypothetical protein
VRLCLIASKPTDAVTYGFLPAAERLGLEVFLLTDQPEAHVGALARAAVVTAQWPAGTGPAGERALAGPVPGIAGRGQARNVPGIVPSDVHDTRALIGLEHVRRALDDLGTSFGPAHTEFTCDGSGGARLIEVNDRLIGDHDEFLLDGLLGDDLFERVLRVHLGERLPAGPPPVRAGHAVADSVLTERSGLLRSAPPCGPLAGAVPGVTLGYWPVRQPGEHVTMTHSNRDYLGIITATGPDRELVERSVSAARIMNRWEVAA